ncbi:hypothetical protein ISU02_14415 [Fusibacter sp. Q10-2]|uniref:Uncharacterized protein n=2 Tax=Fusibacter ferrireducens TaxID=2785058 RepID=A0ABR9ZV22_9FIRM|nr:hypothetical protein [Fusibacter ferrireducens]
MAQILLHIATFESSLDASNQFSLTLFEVEHPSAQLMAQILLHIATFESSLDASNRFSLMLFEVEHPSAQLSAQILLKLTRGINFVCYNIFKVLE